ncbi:MAG: zinc-binding dehydrogenase [Calditrichia bacterium]
MDTKSGLAQEQTGRKIPDWSESQKHSGSSPKMRAAVLESPGAIRIVEKPLPQPGAGEIRIRMEGCGVCGSNREVWEGREWFDYPLEAGAPGHEGWGWIEKTGPGVSSFKIGQRVAALTQHAFAEYDIASADSVVVLPDSLEGQPFPGEPLGCAMNIFRRSDIREGQVVAILGIGFLGALLTQLCVTAGAKVVAVSRRPVALQTAGDFGAGRVIPFAERENIIQTVQELTGGNGCDRVIEVTGKQEPLSLAAELLKVRGKLIIAGFHQDGERTVNMQLWNWRGFDVINAHERENAVYIRGIREAVEAVSNGRLNPQPLFTHEFPLEELPEALNLLTTRPSGFMKALIRF